METTDGLFCQAVEELNRVNKDQARWCAWLDDAYMSIGRTFVASFDDDDTMVLLDTYRDLLKTADTDEVMSEFQACGLSTVQRRPRGSELFDLPIVILVYWLLRHHDIQTISQWPLPKFRDDLELVAADLGISI